MSEIDELIMLSEIAPKLDPPINYRALHRLANSGTNNTFPEVKKEWGVHKFYDEQEIREWYAVYKRVNRRRGRPVRDKR